MSKTNKAATHYRNKAKWNGKKIKQLRDKLNLSQEELAERLGVRRASVSDWENEKHQPYKVFEKALDALNVK